MKKFILISAVLLFSISGFSQTEIPHHKMKKDTVSTGKNNNKTDQTIIGSSYTDCVMMKDGKMMTISYGKETPLTTDIFLINGTKIMTDGTIITKDGTRKVMKEGERIDISGH